jgi:hypothetical protein
MKKLILSAVIVMGTLTLNATSITIKAPVKQLSIVQDDYKEIDSVPAAIKTALDNAYPGVKLDKAYVNDKKEYKIEITVRDQKSTVYTDIKGNILKK